MILKSILFFLLLEEKKKNIITYNLLIKFREASLSISYFNGKEYFKFLMLELDNELLVVKTQKAIG